MAYLQNFKSSLSVPNLEEAQNAPVLSSRGQCHTMKVNLETGEIELLKKRIYSFRVRFEGSEIRRG